MWDNIDQNRHIIGEFLLDGETIPGEVVYNRNSGMIILCLTRILDKPYSLGKSYGKQQYITGKLNSGSVITLYNNRCVENHTHNFRCQTLHFRSEYFILGSKEVAAHKFNRMVCVVENGLQWSGLSQIDCEDLTSVRFKRTDHSRSYEWYGATIKFSTSLKNELWDAPRAEVSKIEEHLQIEIESAEKQSIEYFINVRNCITAMISFAIRDNVNVEEQYLYDFDDTFEIENNITDYNQYPIFSNEPYHPLINTPRFRYNFFLEQMTFDNEVAEKLEKLKPVFNLYLSLFQYNDMPIEMIFLNIVQAIETFHARFFYDNKKKKYIESVNERFGSCLVFDQIKGLLLTDTQIKKSSHILLLSRINDLLIGQHDGLFYEFYGEDNQFAQRVVDTRHYYTHYDKSKEQKALCGDELSNAIEILTWLLEYNVCLQLGIDIREKTVSHLRSYLAHQQFQKEQE